MAESTARDAERRQAFRFPTRGGEAQFEHVRASRGRLHRCRATQNDSGISQGLRAAGSERPRPLPLGKIHVDRKFGNQQCVRGVHVGENAEAKHRLGHGRWNRQQGHDSTGGHWSRQWDGGHQNWGWNNQQRRDGRSGLWSRQRDGGRQNWGENRREQGGQMWEENDARRQLKCRRKQQLQIREGVEETSRGEGAQEDRQAGQTRPPACAVAPQIRVYNVRRTLVMDGPGTADEGRPHADLGDEPAVTIDLTVMEDEDSDVAMQGSPINETQARQEIVVEEERQEQQGPVAQPEATSATLETPGIASGNVQDEWDNLQLSFGGYNALSAVSPAAIDDILTSLQGDGGEQGEKRKRTAIHPRLLAFLNNKPLPWLKSVVLPPFINELQDEDPEYVEVIFDTIVDSFHECSRALQLSALSRPKSESSGCAMHLDLQLLDGIYRSG